MADCGISPVGCLKEIGESILWPPIKSHIDYWWCFDNNIQEITDGIRDLEIKIYDINQKIKEAGLRTDILRPGVDEWSKAATEKLEEARIILQDGINPKAWNLISRYSMGKRAKKAAEEIAKYLNAGNNFNVIADPAPPPATRFTTDRSIIYFESRKRIEEDIIKSLKESSVGMIGICGMGGLGKTTMAKRIRERVMEEKLFDEVVMVVVSQQINMLKIQNEVAELLDLKFEVESLHARADKLRKRLMDANRKIIVFDDVWEKLKLEDLGVPSGFEGCKILLTTRYKKVCEQMEVLNVVPMEILTEDDAWTLFKDKAGNCVEDSDFLSVAKNVVAECKCLPLALVTVGKALRNKRKSEWEDSLLQLRQSNPDDFSEVLKDVYNPLKLSYDHLDNEREKLLFLLCCLFPEDHSIPIEELTFYFMGLRMFDSITSIENARHRVQRLIDNLKSRFLLIDGREDGYVKMHDMVRDVAIYIGSKVEHCLAKSLNEVSKENSSKINWISVDVSNGPMNVDMGLRFPKLHLLMLLNLSSDISLEGMGDLNVLSFSNISIGSLPSTLQNLKTLYLYSCKVEDISVIGKLAGLEILYCHDCHEIKDGTIILNQNVSSLCNLKSVIIRECSKLRYLFSVSVATTCLLQLEELSIYYCEAMEQVFRNDITYGCIQFPKLKELRLRHLPKLTAFCQGLQTIKFPKLNSFCAFNSETSNPKVEIGGLNNNIRNINLEDCKSGINVFPMLETLELFALDNMEEMWDDTIILNQNVSSLRNLKSVKIGGCYKLRYLFSVSVATTCVLQLQVLDIKHCSAMEQVFRNDMTDGCIQFPELKELTLILLPKLTAFCQGIENIKFPQLTHLDIGELPKLNSFCPLNSETPHDDRNHFHFLCNPKVEIGGLECLYVCGSNNNIRSLWCNQIPINFFNNLQELIFFLDGIRSLMSYSIAKNLLSLKTLEIKYCEDMVEVIEGNDDDKQVVDIKCFFPTLKTLSFFKLPKLRRFWQWNHALELSLLEEVSIYDCPLMETFTLGSLNTPNLRRLEINGQAIDDHMKDLNDILNHHFRTKSQNTSMIEEEEEEED